MNYKTGLVIVFLLYLTVLCISAPIYLNACNYFEEGIQSALVTYITAYIIYSAGLTCLLKYATSYDMFEVFYIILMNLFPFTLFYIIGIVAMDNTIIGVSNILNFFYG